MKISIRLMCFFLAVSPLSAEISFLSPDINARNEFLFTVKADLPGQDAYQTLFRQSLDTGKREQLTMYPEALEALSGGSILQIRNRFGIGRYDAASDSFSWMEHPKPFFAGGGIKAGNLNDVASSPDGAWQVSIEPVSPSRGRLVIYDTAKDRQCTLSESVERGNIPVTWAPDSSILIYELSGALYFARPESFFSSSFIDARYRTLGKGTIASIGWFSSSRLLFASGSSVYRIQVAELFARSLYTPLIGIGELAGKLPSDFDPTMDALCSSPDGSSILFAKDKRNVYYCPLEGDDYVSSTRPALVPYLLLPGNTASLSFYWADGSVPTVFSESVEDGKRIFKAWRVTDIASGKIFSQIALPSGIKAMCPLPEKGLCLFITSQGLHVYNASTWKEMTIFKDEAVVSAVWGEDGYIYIGGKETIRKWNYRTGNSALLFLSAAHASGWDEQATSIVVETAKMGRFAYAGNLKWNGATTLKIRAASSGANASWRLYLDSGKGFYANMLYARSATSPGGTKALLDEPSVTIDPLLANVPSSAAYSPESDVLTHGSRTGFRQLALVFDAMDSLDGLPKILHTLDRYKIRATFFINGEFIRQHPAAVNEIIRAGHQTASLFFTTWDLSGSQYRIDEDFIVRGLARNEDDFYTATGQELTLLWHAPYYVTSPLIIASGKKAGYRYVSGDVTVLDWVSAEQSRTMPGLYRSSAELIEDIIAAKKPGSIIPVRIGKVDGERSDYLYDKIDLLINALTEAGYTIVSLDTLIQNMR